MQATGIALLLLTYLAASEEQHASENTTWELQPSWEMLSDLLSAIGKVIDFSADQAEFLNLDGIIGLRSVDDQFSLFLEQYESSLVSESARDILKTLNSQRWKARNVSKIAISYDNTTQFEYFDHLGSVLRDGQWAMDYPLRSLGSIEHTWADLNISFTWDNSNDCLHEILGSSTMESPPCNMTERCWNVMTFPLFTGYGITHQLLFLEVGEMAGCGSLMSDFAMSNGQRNISTIQDFLCSNILSEAKHIQEMGYPSDHQDLFLEQIFLCGVLGYQEFLPEDWLEEILSWQDSTGCYTLDELKGKRTKREEKKLKGDCGSHKTSLALGALTTYVRYVLRALLGN